MGDVFGGDDKKGGGGGEEGAFDAADRLLDMSEQLFAETGPARSGSLSLINQVLTGGRPTSMASITIPERETIEGQFANARENIIENTPGRGGQMNNLLGQAEIGRAQAVAGLDAEIRRAAFQGAMQAGFGAPGPAFQGAAGAGNIYGDIASTQAQQDAAKKQSTGALVGIAAAAAFSCWIAAAIYGENTREFLLARWWIYGQWRGPLADFTRCVYSLVGPHVAPYVKRWPWLRALLKPLFDIAVRRALKTGCIV